MVGQLASLHQFDVDASGEFAGGEPFLLFLDFLASFRSIRNAGRSELRV